MPGHSLAVEKLLVDNHSRLEPWFGGASASTARPEIFWRCASVLVASDLLETSRPAEVSIGRDSIKVPCSLSDWDFFAAELGWNDENVRKLALDVLRTQFLTPNFERQPRNSSDGLLSELLPPLLLGLLLLTCVLERMGRRGRPHDYAYRTNGLRQVATEDMDWAAIGTIDDTGLAQRLLEHAGSGLSDSPNLLQVPYHAYWRPLYLRLIGRHERRPSMSADRLREREEELQLPSDFLLRTLQDADKEATTAIAQPAREPRVKNEAVLNEMKRLREENDALRAATTVTLLPALLQPFLTLSGDPMEALEQAVNSSSGLARNVVMALRTALLSGDVSFIGELGAVMKLALPCADYRLEWRGRPRDWSKASMRVGRRGIRVRGLVVVQALVTPEFENAS